MGPKWRQEIKMSVRGPLLDAHFGALWAHFSVQKRLRDQFVWFFTVLLSRLFFSSISDNVEDAKYEENPCFYRAKRTSHMSPKNDFQGHFWRSFWTPNAQCATRVGPMVDKNTVEKRHQKQTRKKVMRFHARRFGRIEPGLGRCLSTVLQEDPQPLRALETLHFAPEAR
jgi:hypothetical protein